jgi:hypothetical protein
MGGDTYDIQDTLMVKHKNILDESAWYSKSYSYYWLVEEDTLNFVLHVTEWKNDSTLHLRLFHKKPILFTEALGRIEMCLPLITEDFNISKFSSFHFMEPIFYFDLAMELSNEYEQEFGQKRVNYRKLNEFLLRSSSSTQLNHFLNPLNKKVRWYGFEKFHLIDKENFKEYLPNIDFTEYPEFTLNAHNGMSVNLENK